MCVNWFVQNMTTTNVSPLISNTSNTPHSFLADVTTRADWLVPVVVVLTLMTASLWLLFSLIHYGIKTRKWKRRLLYNSDKLNAGAVYACVVGCASMCFARSVFNFTFLIIGFHEDEDELCDAVADVRFVFYALEIFSVQLFLWFRQRIFYTNGMLRVQYSAAVKCFSFIVIIALFLSGLFAVVYNTVPNNHFASPLNGCIYLPSEGLRPAFWISAAVVIVFGQMALVGLFVYALCRSKLERRRDRRRSSAVAIKLKTSKSERYSIANESDGTNVEQLSSANRKLSVIMTTHLRTKRRGQTVRTILWKTIIFATLSILFDIFLLLFAQYAIPRLSHRRFSVMISDINTFLNLIFLVLSFTHYKDMMTSPCSTTS